MLLPLGITVLLAFLLLFQSGTDAAFGSKKRRAKQRLEQQEAVDAGAAVDHDRESLLSAVRALKDPSTMMEVQQLMSDPAFVREMERLKMDPNSAGAIKSAKDLYGNADKAAEIFGKLARHKSNEPVSKTTSSTLLKAAKDPQALSHAMDLLSSNAEAKGGESEQEALAT